MSGGLIKGSCLCGGVGYQLEGDGVLIIGHCHCSLCRKALGAAFASFLMVLIADFAWTKGEQLMHKYESSEGIFRCHCGCCGSPLPLQDPHLSLMAVPAGSLNTDIPSLMHVETFTGDALSFLRTEQGSGLVSLLEEAPHLAFLSFPQRESKAYWLGFLDKVNTRRAQLGLDVFPADFLEQIAQRGDIG